MATDNPRVRDFSSQTPSFPVVVEASPVHELLLSLFVWGNRKDSEQYDCGSTFFEQIEDGVSPTMVEKLQAMSDCGEIWLSLIGVAHVAGVVTSTDSFLAHLRAMDAIELRRTIVTGHHAKDNLSAEELDAVANGDLETIEKLAAQEHTCDGLVALMKTEPVETQRQIIDTITAMEDVLEPAISDLLPGLRRDADEKRALARTMEPTALVESATNGVTFKMQPQITGVLLIPSKIIRPWTVIMDHAGIAMFAYSVADEHLLADPDAPPNYLVDLYKALGDERRLRILAMLSEGDAALMEIAERVDLAKSTAHHHLRILRSAGLVRVTVGDTKTYSLRRSQLPEVGRMLDAYLTTPTQAAENAPTGEQQRS